MSRGKAKAKRDELGDRGWRTLKKYRVFGTRNLSRGHFEIRLNWAAPENFDQVVA